MDTEERKSQLDIALSFALEQVELFHDANKVCYAKRLNNGYVWRLTSQAFKDYLFAAFHQTFDKALRTQNLTEVINQLSAIARCERRKTRRTLPGCRACGRLLYRFMREQQHAGSALGGRWLASDK